MEHAAPTVTRREDYTPPAFLIDTIDLHFDLYDDHALVHSRLTGRRNPETVGPDTEPLVLDAVDLDLKAVILNGTALMPVDMDQDGESVTIRDVPDQFVLETTSRLKPQDNTALEGLYRSGNTFCTQCEAQGFRRITPFPDRPDVMARYSATIEADIAHAPVLLSNGNPVARGTSSDARRHWVRWEDPFPKPSYLFALVAGDLRRVSDHFTTVSGRSVDLGIYVEPGNEDKCAHAMHALKRAMAWDEAVFGLEYDLDILNIVAVDSFNMGAMENKGLNIFNTKYILANPDIATDTDYQQIEAVVAHEYFHNWTGNRVTCRDWFQLSLKEGLTVFRDQEFTADTASRPLKRISDVQRLRAAQFPEDAGPLAHPVRPDFYIQINNFYTPTVYEKGAEVIRMMHTLLGPERFRKGMDLYFQRHDGQAVTCDDFTRAMADASGIDLDQFKLWYSQAGTPNLSVTGLHDPVGRTYTVTVRQSVPATPGQATKHPMHMPLAVGLLDHTGAELALRLVDEPEPGPTGRVLNIRAAEQRFTFTDIAEPPVPSLLRSFSAPVNLTTDLSDADLAFLMTHDRDGFNRWEAGNTLATRILLRMIDTLRTVGDLDLPTVYVNAFAACLDRADDDAAFAARALNLPTEGYLAQQMTVVDVDAIHTVRETARRSLGQTLRPMFWATHARYAIDAPYSIEPTAMGQRALRNLALAYLMTEEDEDAIVLGRRQFDDANNMTDRLSALGLFTHTDVPDRLDVLDRFYRDWRHEPLVVDKWLAIQALSQRSDTLDAVQALMQHPAFDRLTPNKVYALLLTFGASNQLCFHAATGAGYRFLADQVLAMDALNPQVAARLAGPFARWRRFDASRQVLMRDQLERIMSTANLSRGVYEIASKSLENA